MLLVIKVKVMLMEKSLWCFIIRFHFYISLSLCGENASASGSLDLLFRALAEESSLDNDGLGGESAFAEHLEDTLKKEMSVSSQSKLS